MNLESNSKNKLFITIDGPNCVGKTTLCMRLNSHLNRLGYNVFLTKEPSDSIIGNMVRSLEGDKDYNGLPLAHLIAADRYHHCNKIKLKLSQGSIVISDRYVGSSLVYQIADGIDEKYAWFINSEILIPDISFFIFDDIERLKYRLAQRAELRRFEKEVNINNQILLYKSAMSNLTEKGFTCYYVDNTSSIDLAFQQIIDKIRMYLS